MLVPFQNHFSFWKMLSEGLGIHALKNILWLELQKYSFKIYLLLPFKSYLFFIE